MSEAYREDLAYIHDVGFCSFAQNAATGLMDILHRRCIKKGLVVDLGCGSGIWARILVDAGYSVYGIDISCAMLEIAKKRVPEGKFAEGSLLKVKIPQCDIVTSMGECLNYAFDEDNSEKELFSLFQRIYEALHPEGIFIFDILEPGYIGEGNPEQKYAEGRDWVTIVKREENTEEKTLTRKIISFRKIGKYYRRDDEIHRLRLYNGADIKKYLRQIGFRVNAIHGYGKLRFERSHAGFLAVKPSL